MTELLKCCICGDLIEPHPVSDRAEGNNAQPVKDGRCCDKCNLHVVIPVRVFRVMRQKNELRRRKKEHFE